MAWSMRTELFNPIKLAGHSHCDTLISGHACDWACLVDPVRVEDSEAPQLAASTLLSHALQIALGLQLCDALVHRLAIHDSLHASPFRVSLDAQLSAADDAFAASKNPLSLQSLAASTSWSPHLVHRLFASTSPDAYTVDHIALLGLVAQPPGLVRP